jgi:putative transposase
MLTDKEFEVWYRKLGLKGEALELIKTIRTSEPVRLVTGWGKSIIGQYPSLKMGRSLQFESSRCELAFIHTMEHDDDVLEMWDQPFELRLTFLSKTGRRVSVPHVPDFFVCRREGAGFIECKTEGQMAQLVEEQPNRYCRGENGAWHCPAAEEAAKELGVTYAIVTTAKIDPVYIRNIEFLQHWLRKDALLVTADAQEVIISTVREHRGIILGELLEYVLGYEKTRIKPDDVYALVVRGDIYVDLHAAPLVERNIVRVYENAELAEIYTPIGSLPLIPRPRGLSIIEGARLIWDGRPWEIANVGEKKVWLVGETGGAALTHQQFEDFISRGLLELLDFTAEASPYSEGLKIINDAESSARAEAERRLELIKPYLNKETTLWGAKKERTIRRYIAAFRVADAHYGVGLVGLLPNWFAEGKRVKRLPDEVYRLMDEQIDGNYETLVQKGVWSVYSTFGKLCDKEGIPVEKQPTYVTFWNRVKSRNLADSTRKRKGKRAAYQYETLMYWIDKDTPRHGDFPLHIAHADNTELDIELVCPITGENLGRPWASFLVDAYTRLLLAIVVTFDPPSYRTTMLLLRECARKRGKMPQILIVDRGSEFDNNYLLRVTPPLGITVKFRPRAKPKVGSVGERLFGTANDQFVHNLLGNTQLMKEVRKVTKSVNPKTNAVWTLEPLAEFLTAWGYEFYNERPHWSLKHTPIKEYARTVRLTGEDRGKVRYDENFRITTMPTTRKGYATYSAGKGFKINYIYYDSIEFEEACVHGKQYSVRYDPHDLSYAHVRAGGRWIKCLSDYYATFAYCTERQLKIITNEMHRRNKRMTQKQEITAKLLAEFIARAEKAQQGQAEQRLLRQRVHDREARALVGAVNGGSYTPPSLRQQEVSGVSDALSAEPTAAPATVIDFSKIKPAKELK